MKQLFIPVFLTFLVFNIAYAQTTKPVRATFNCHVSNKSNGEPLYGASVYFPDIKTGGVTNEAGNLSLQNVPKGKFLIEVSFLGFSSVAEPVEVSGNVEKSFALSPSYVEAEAVTVTGVSSATSVRRTPVPVTIIKKDELLRGSSTNLIDALAKQPGIAQISTGPGISKPVIRGLGFNRVVVVNDGIRQEGQQWGDEHGIEIDEYNVNKAEILKGPASLMYGSDALAGVINFISFIPVPQGSIKGNLFATYMTNNRQRGFHGDIGGNNNGYIWGAYGSYKAAADYQNKYDGYVFNSKFNEKDFGGHFGLNKHWGYSHFLVSSFDQNPGLVEGTRDSATGKFLKTINNIGMEEEVIAKNEDFKSTNPDIPNQRIQHLKLTTDNSFNLGKNRLTLTAAFQRNQRKEFGNILLPDEPGLYFDLKTINYNLQYHFLEKINWKTTIGVNGMHQTNENKGQEFLIPAYSLVDIGGFIHTQKRWNKMTLSGGGRFDNRHIDSKLLQEGGEVKFAPFSKKFSNISASAGLSYEAGKTVTLKLNLARGFRAPSISELASNGAHEGTVRYEYGEQNLQSETSTQIDAGVELGTEHVSLSANIFYTSINNFIYYRKLQSTTGGDSILTDGTQELFAFRFNQDNAKLYGIEANLDIHPHPWDWLHIENTFSYVKGTLSEIQDGSKNLPSIPAARLINEIKVDFLKKGKGLRNVYAKVELDNTFAQLNAFTGYNTETATPAYSLLNAGVGGEYMHKGKKLFGFYLTASNITDVAYQSHLSRLKYTDVNNVTGRQGVFNMGRNFSMKINVPLSF